MCSVWEHLDEPYWCARSSVLIGHLQTSSGVGINNLERSRPPQKTHRGMKTNKKWGVVSASARVFVSGAWFSISPCVKEAFNDIVLRTFHPPLSPRIVRMSAAIFACQSNCIKNVIKNHSNRSWHDALQCPAALPRQPHMQDSFKLREGVFSGRIGQMTETSRLRVHMFGSPTGGIVRYKTSRLGCSCLQIMLKMNLVWAGSTTSTP